MNRQKSRHMARFIHDVLRGRLHLRAGLVEFDAGHKLDFDKLKKSEWSPRFEELMRNRLLMGALRYGLMHAKGKPKYDRLAGARKRLQQYEETGNLECLVDVANMALLEFEEGRHPHRHWDAINGDHCCV